MMLESRRRLFVELSETAQMALIAGARASAGAGLDAWGTISTPSVQSHLSVLLYKPSRRLAISA